VANGWAVAYRRYSKAYVPYETVAQREKRGLWSGAFIMPWDYRHKRKP
jgi:endonuclease YncB( thermonuclease family)